LLRAVEVAGDHFGELVRGRAVSSSPNHKALHKAVVQRVIDGKLELFTFREVGKLLSVHPRESLLKPLKSVMSGRVESELWLIREIEVERRELLIHESGNWI
jgi:hypothetical protein